MDIDLAGRGWLSVIEHAAKRKIIILPDGIRALPGKELLSLRTILIGHLGER